MTRRYTLAPSARVDLDEIWFYIARKSSIEVAESVVEAITGVFPLLAANPAMGRHRPNLGEAMRSFPVANYRIYYRQDSLAAFEFCMSNMPPATREPFQIVKGMLPLSSGDRRSMKRYPNGLRGSTLTITSSAIPTATAFPAT